MNKAFSLLVALGIVIVFQVCKAMTDTSPAIPAQVNCAMQGVDNTTSLPSRALKLVPADWRPSPQDERIDVAVFSFIEQARIKSYSCSYERRLLIQKV